MILVFVSSFAFAGATPTEVFVQSTKAQLKAAPKMDAAIVQDLKRGEKLIVKQKKGFWYQVSVGENEGWVSKLFVSTHKPVGQAELLKDQDNNLAMSSRRRAKPQAVSAATRGLLEGGNRARGGKAEKYRPDPAAVKRMEKLGVSETEVTKFVSEGKLSD